MKDMLSSWPCAFYVCLAHMIIYIYIWLQLRGSDFNIDGSKFKVQLG